MKIKDFKAGSSTGSMGEIQHRLGRNPKIKFVNALKETEYQTTIDNLTKKAIKLDSVTANLKTVSVQKQEAIQAKHAAESKLEELISSFEMNKNSLQQYEDREPRIKNIIEQHRELNGEVADLQSKLQLVVEQHDEKVDVINDNIKTISTLEDSLHSSETSSAKAHQAKLEAVVEKDEVLKQLSDATKKIHESGIIDKGRKENLDTSEKTINQLRLQMSDKVQERDEALSLAKKIRTLGDKVSQENRRTQSESSQVNKTNNKLEDDVIEMTSIIKTLQEDISFVSQQNKEMFEELKKPRFASIAAITNKEGFKFPTSFEPRGNSLGMGKPTLLRKKG